MSKVPLYSLEATSRPTHKHNKSYACPVLQTQQGREVLKDLPQGGNAQIQLRNIGFRVYHRGPCLVTNRATPQPPRVPPDPGFRVQGFAARPQIPCRNMLRLHAISGMGFTPMTWHNHLSIPQAYAYGLYIVYRQVSKVP